MSLGRILSRIGVPVAFAIWLRTPCTSASLAAGPTSISIVSQTVMAEVVRVSLCVVLILSKLCALLICSLDSQEER